MALAINIPPQTTIIAENTHQDDGELPIRDPKYINNVANEADATNIHPYISPISAKTGCFCLLHDRESMIITDAPIKYNEIITIRVDIRLLPKLSGQESLIML